MVQNVDMDVLVDSVAMLASKGLEWKYLPISEKTSIIREIISILQNMTMEDDFIPLLGIPEMQMIGFDIHADDTSTDILTSEGHCEAAQSSMLNAVIVCQAMKQLLEAYQYNSDLKDSNKSKRASSSAVLHIQPTKVNEDQLVVVTAPITTEEQFTPFGKSKVELYLQPTEKFEPFTLSPFLDETSEKNTQAGCMVVLGAGNQTFLSIMDCIYGLFHCHCTVILKHHPIRTYHDRIIRKILHPLISRGYFNTECYSDSLADRKRAQELIYHPLVSHVHMTGSKATHDTIVWGSPEIPLADRIAPKLQAHMTSELGCITPWIVAPITNKPWTPQQLQHQTQHLFASIYGNAGANCNSPKVLLLPSTWTQKDEFMELLKTEMKRHPLPISYYPGSTERYESFRAAYPNDHITIGTSTKEEKGRRKVKDSAIILPWMVITLPAVVDISTESGRQIARQEFAFQHEPFCPILTIAQYGNSDSTECETCDNYDDIMTAVSIANDYIYGTLSCTLVTNDDESLMNHSNPRLEEAIHKLRYGDIAINCWSALLYAAPGSATWGAYPGESLSNVVSGIGQVQNHYFIPNVEKSVLRSNIVDVGLHIIRPKSFRLTRMEQIVIGNLSLRPSCYNILNLISVMTTGYVLPSTLVSKPVWISILVAATSISALHFCSGKVSDLMARESKK